MSLELWQALALVLIIEGALPFASPQGAKRLWAQALRLEDRVLRWLGGACMVLGLLALLALRPTA